MQTARIYKEDLMNMAVWKQILKDLELPEDVDEITVITVAYNSKSKRKKALKGKKK